MLLLSVHFERMDMKLLVSFSYHSLFRRLDLQNVCAPSIATSILCVSRPSSKTKQKKKKELAVERQRHCQRLIAFRHALTWRESTPTSFIKMSWLRFPYHFLFLSCVCVSSYCPDLPKHLRSLSLRRITKKMVAMSTVY